MTTQEGEKKRGILEITKVEARQEVGEKKAVKLAFTAKPDGQESILKFFTFRKTLMDSIEQAVGKKLDCEWEAKSREYDGNTYTDRNVQQIYISGQPIGQPRSDGGGGGGRGFYGKPPEQVAAERASIESQTAYNGIVELLTAKIIDLGCPYADAALDWALAKLGGKADAVTPTATATLVINPLSTGHPPPPGDAPQGKPEGKGIDWGPIAKKAAAMGLRNDKGVATIQVLCKALKISKLTDWTEPAEVALDTLYEYARLNGYNGVPWREIQV